MPHPEPLFAPPPEPVPFTFDPRVELPGTAAVVVVGGGMLGASAAYHLARAGMRPLVIEANAPAWGASGRNAGMALAGLGRTLSARHAAGGRRRRPLDPGLHDSLARHARGVLLDFASLEMPLAGPLPAEDGTPLPGAYVAAGLTGHGHPYAPILGLLMAELISGGEARTLSLAPFDPRRYVGVMHAPTWLEPFQGTSPIPR